ncbi:MAG: homoserine dehydrogenase [Nitrososphaerota archaeon]
MSGVSLRALVNGYGFLGRRVARALASGKVPGVKLVAVARSTGYIHRPGGLTLEELEGDIASLEGFVEGSPISLLEDGKVDLLIELTPTNLPTGEPALTHIKTALSRGIDVVTANKAPIALAYRELTELSRSTGALLLFEGTVGGGIPLVSLRRFCLRGDEVLSIRGILNGTTNYILSRMHFEGLTFELALREAQNLGIAERDPTLDIEGYDTALKLLILANSVMGLNRRLEDVRITGISRVTADAVSLAKEAGLAVKLIGSVSPDGHLSVAPRLVKLSDPICVHGTLNAVTFRLRTAGDLTLIGEGAGEPTVTSILNDVWEVVSVRARLTGARGT